MGSCSYKHADTLEEGKVYEARVSYLFFGEIEEEDWQTSINRGS